MKFDKKYTTFMENTSKPFQVKINSLYSPKSKLEDTVDELNKKNYSYNKGKPIIVSKVGNGKYFVIDGNHRALEAASDGKTHVTVVIDEFKPDFNKVENFENKMKSARKVSDYADQIEEEIDESRIPNEIPRYLYHATYKQMLPTLKKGGGLKAGAFLSKSFKEAYKDAQMLENLDEDWKENIIVFKINTGKLDPKKITVDNKDKPKDYTYNGIVPFGNLVRNG